MAVLADPEGDAAPAVAEAPPRLCPSARAEMGATLIGVVRGDGRVDLLGRPIPVNEAFLATAREGRAPERRFRFSAPCVRAECGQWAGGRCGVIDRVLDSLAPELAEGEPALAPCGIRGDCRWFAQRGPSACAACPEIVTETRA